MPGALDLTPQTREWLFKDGGQVYGPVPEARLTELIVEGRIGARTPVAGEDGAWRPLEEVPGFLVHLRKAEAHARVQAEVTGAARIARRRHALQGSALILAIFLVVALLGVGAYLVAARRFDRRSALLEDFGDGIALTAARVGGGARAGAADDEIAIPDAALGAPQAGAAPAARPRPSAAPRATRSGPVSGTAEGGDLVLAQYDPRRIQEVVRRSQGSLAPCLRDEARRSPEFSGDIPIEFAVGNDGRVAALWIDEPRFKTGPLRDCLLQRLREWSFDKFPGQRPVVSLSFRISPL